MHNSTQLIGNLGNDPILTYAQTGTAICKLSVATTSSVKRNDQWEKETQWHRVTVFGKRAETCNQYLKKGSKVFVEGMIKYGSYEKEGIKHYTTDIIASNVNFLDKPTGELKEPSQGGAMEIPRQDEFTSDSIPF